MRFGVALFDDHSRPGREATGIAALDNIWAAIGTDGPLRVRSIQDLPSDVLWITNLELRVMKAIGLNKQPAFRPDSYLRTTLRQIADEIGASTLAAPDLCGVLAEIFHGVMTKASAAGLTEHRNYLLHQEMGRLIQPTVGCIPTEIYPLFEVAALHNISKPIATVVANDLSPLTVRRNRVHHSRDLLSMPVPPDRPWQMIGKHLLPSGSSAMQAWLGSHGRPFMVRATIRNMDPSVADILSPSGGSKDLREWWTDIEWRVFSQYADLDYEEVLLCELPARPAGFAQLLPQDPFAPLSYINGLFSEQIWTGLTTGHPAQRNGFVYPAAAAWLRAEDRMIMFRYAKALHASGVRVTSYGVGAVTVRYAERGLRHTMECAINCGLVPPADKFVEAKRQGLYDDEMEAARAG